MDEMIIYKEIPLNLSLRHIEKEQNEKIAIKVNEIASIVLLKNPSKNSLQTIEKAREKQGIAEAKDEYWGDYQPPVWYHEVITDMQKIEYLAQFF